MLYHFLFSVENFYPHKIIQNYLQKKLVTLLIILTVLCSILCHSLQINSHRVLVAGSTGYIGRAVVRELVSRGIPVGSLIRSNIMSDVTKNSLKGSQLLECDISNQMSIQNSIYSYNPTVIISCLASRSGIGRDAFAIDYKATADIVNTLAELSKKQNVKKHFVLLSAYCCGKPRLQFQLAKLKIEQEVRSMNSSLSHSIVRPTAFFKSLDGQIERILQNQPILYFGDGSCAANPISEKDLANFLIDCALCPERINMLDQTRDIGGPDVPPITKLQQIDMMYNSLGIPMENRRKISIPMGVFNFLIQSFTQLENIFDLISIPSFKERCNDAAELARIVQYYASEPMVAIGPGEVQGTETLQEHFNTIASRGGKLIEIDSMTTTAGVLDVFTRNEYAK